MSEKAKQFAAVGTFGDDGTENTVDVPGDIAEVLSKMDEITAKYDMGDILSDEDKAIVKAYLPAIGVDETSLSADNALVGEGTFAFDRSELGLDLHAEGEMGCKGVGEGRIEWNARLDVKKTGGEGAVNSLKFIFQGIGFGVGPTGAMKVIYKRDFDRTFKAADAASASFFDRYTLAQWGFYYTARCEVLTDEGTIVLK